MYKIGIDLGGTNIVAGVVDEKCNIVSKQKIKTNLPKAPEDLVKDLVNLIETTLRSINKDISDIKSIGIGMPGIIDSKNGVIDYASNFGYKKVNLVKPLKEKLNVEVKLENDANVAIFGEMINGAAKDAKDVVMLTLGTGVGGGVIIDGKIYSGFNNQGAELGHVGIVFEGRQCLCGKKGCIEMYCSATALINDTKKVMEENKDSLLWKVCENDISKVSGRTIFKAMEEKDLAAKKVFDTYIEYLGYAISNYINVFQPEVLIIGGGISSQKDILLKPLIEYAKKNSLGFDGEFSTKIKTSELLDDAAIIGAAFL